MFFAPATGGGEGDPGASAPVNGLGSGFFSPYRCGGRADGDASSLNLFFWAAILLSSACSRRRYGVDSRRLLGAVRLGFVVVWRDLVSGTSELFNGSMATTAVLGRWSLRARARRLPGYYRQGQADFDRGAAAVARRRLVLAAIVIVRRSQNLDAIFIMFEILCTFGEF